MIIWVKVEPKLNAKLQAVNVKIMFIFQFMDLRILNVLANIRIKHMTLLRKIAKVVHANNLFRTGRVHVE